MASQNSAALSARPKGIGYYKPRGSARCCRQLRSEFRRRTSPMWTLKPVANACRYWAFRRSRSGRAKSFAPRWRSASSVFHVIEGGGDATVDGVEMAWGGSGHHGRSYPREHGRCLSKQVCEKLTLTPGAILSLFV